MKFFAVLQANLDALEKRLGPQPEIDAIRAALPKTGRPKGAAKNKAAVEAAVREWVATGFQEGGRPISAIELGARVGVSSNAIFRCAKRLGLELTYDWHGMQAEYERQLIMPIVVATKGKVVNKPTGE